MDDKTSNNIAMKLDYKHEDIDLEIEFDFHAPVPATHDTPSEVGYVDVTDILHEGESIFEIINSDIIAEIEEQVYNSEADRRTEPPELE